MGHDNSALEGLPEPGEPVFYPKVGHCIYRGVTEDRVAPGTQLLELEDLEEGSRILIPLPRVPQLNLRPAGTAFEEIQEVLSAEFEVPLEDEDERHELVDSLITDGSPRALAQSLKRLHLLRQTVGLSREEEQTRKKIRSWLAAEVSISRECTRAEAQAFMTRMLQESMAQHEKKEKEEAKQRRRAAREQKKAEEAEAAEAAAAALSVGHVLGSPSAPESEPEPAAATEAESAAATEAEPEPDGESEIAAATGSETAARAETASTEAEPEPDGESDDGDGERAASAADETVEAEESAEETASADRLEGSDVGASETAPESRPDRPPRAEEETPLG